MKTKTLTLTVLCGLAVLAALSQEKPKPNFVIGTRTPNAAIVIYNSSWTSSKAPTTQHVGTTKIWQEAVEGRTNFCVWHYGWTQPMKWDAHTGASVSAPVPKTGLVFANGIAPATGSNNAVQLWIEEIAGQTNACVWPRGWAQPLKWDLHTGEARDGNPVLATLRWEVVTNWVTLPFTFKNAIYIIGGEDQSITNYNEIGTISSNLVADIVWKGQVVSSTLESVHVGTTNRSYTIGRIYR